MTTLTPPSAENIALMHEFTRQFESGERDAGYWQWEAMENGAWQYKLGPTVPSPFKPYYQQRYTPAPAHPHYAKYIEWTRLVDAGEVAKGWWNVLTWHSVVGTSCYTPEPKWFPDFDYEIRKTDKHPDNCKLKLIDWNNVPVLSQTNHGLWLGFEAHYPGSDKRGLALCGAYVKIEAMFSFRLAEQTTFTHLPKGTPPPVVEGLVFEYEYLTQCSNGNSIRTYSRRNLTGTDTADCIASRVIGCAPGYTDNPKLA